MYSILGFGKMIADQTRMQAYAAALREAVRPGSVVLDIGAGTGIMTLLACRLGARKVYAVEPGDSIELARQTIRENGFAGRVEFFQALSTEISLPEKADVVVSDIRGVLPPLQTNLADLIDARHRLLAPGGSFIPRSDRLFAALLEDPERFQEHVGIWASRPFGLELHSAVPFAANSWSKARALPERLLSEPEKWATIDYLELEQVNLHGKARLSPKRDGAAHGLLLWFDASLTGTIGFTNAPGGPELIYGQAFFPWPEAVSLREGDVVDVELRADPVRGDYVWTWNSLVRRRGEQDGAAPVFRQSTFLSEPILAGKLRKSAETFLPRLGKKGQIDLFALGMMTGERSLKEIASVLRDRFPETFPDYRKALAKVSTLSTEYGE
jgi:type I protein arginine methyltransferase